MTELFCAALIFVVVFIIGGLYVVGNKLLTNIITRIKGFIKWQRFRLSKKDWDED